MLIPRVFHQVWVGPDPFPDKLAGFRQTWLDHNPGWELRLWTEDDLPDGFRRPEAYERIRSPVERCDILRLELVYRFGGVYVDTDFECLRPLEPLIEDVDFFVGDIEQGRVNHAIMGAVAGHPILERALDEIRPREFYGYDKAATGPLFFDRVLKGFPDAKVFEKRYFYEKGETARQDGYALHHDANSWKSPEQLRIQAEKERARARKKRDEARRWRRRYEEAEAKLARARRVAWPLLKLSARARRR